MKRAKGTKRFSTYEVPKKPPPSLTWTHKFVCLADMSSDLLPSSSEKYNLKCAGLGEKKIVFRLNGSYSHLKEELLQAFPALEKCGGFELTRTDGPYSRNLAPIDPKFLTSVAKLKEFIDQARIYIRPLQADVPLDAKSTSDVEEKNVSD